MARPTIRLKGPALARFLRRVVAGRDGVDPVASRAVARDLSRLLASADVRRVSWSRLQARRAVRCEASPDPDPAANPKPVTNGMDATQTHAHPQAQAPAVSVGMSQLDPSPAAQPQTQTPAPAEAPAPAFDPFVFGLIPVYQREGLTGLRGRLDAIDSIENLRKMARAQKIGLPAEIRRGDVPATAVRDAIITAVEKRIADRRAAAS